MIDVFLVTSEGACGIAEHSAYLREALKPFDDIQVRGNPESLDPQWFWQRPTPTKPQIVHLNYHAALHSRWTPGHIAEMQTWGVKVLITYHDTGVPNSQQCLDLYAVADAFVVHEPCKDLPKAHYWRQGIPAPHQEYLVPEDGRPVVGTVGFPFHWKNYDLLCEAAREAGWSVLLLAPDATDDQIKAWFALNPNLAVTSAFLPRDQVVGRLRGCDATAFLYNTHNTGTSGAIRQGIAARKPVIASRFPFGRQFRDLHADPVAARVITWIEPTLEQVVEALSRVKIAPLDAGMVRLAEQDSWTKLGQQYARLYRSLIS